MTRRSLLCFPLLVSLFKIPDDRVWGLKVRGTEVYVIDNGQDWTMYKADKKKAKHFTLTEINKFSKRMIYEIYDSTKFEDYYEIVYLGR